MQVKITKTGKLAVTLSLADRANIYEGLISFLETETARLLFVKVEKCEEVMRHLYVATLTQIIVKSFALNANWEARLLLTRSEAIALMWFLRSENDLTLLNLKGELHKTMQLL